MSAKHVGLGRGLGALIKETPTPEEGAGSAAQAGITTVPTNHVHKSPWQPRRHFAPEALDELVRSVHERGVLQPLLVRRLTPRDETEEFELIAGERRLRAAQEAEVEEVPVIIMDVSDGEALELALVENLQREDLNIIEEAEGYAALADTFHLTQDEIAQRVGKARTTVANCLRLLGLPDSIKQLLAEGQLSAGHAKVLLGVEIPEEQALLARRTAKEGLSVRVLEQLVARHRGTPKKPRTEKPDIPADHLKYLVDRLHQHLGTSVRVTPCKTLANGKKSKGSIEIDYYSNEELDRLLQLLGLTEDL